MAVGFLFCFQIDWGAERGDGGEPGHLLMRMGFPAPKFNRALDTHRCACLQISDVRNIIAEYRGVDPLGVRAGPNSDTERHPILARLRRSLDRVCTQD